MRLLRVKMRRDYRECFSTPAGKAVLADLAKFTGAREDLFHSDPNKTAYVLGMRRVFLRITSFLNMSLQEIDALTRAEGDEHE